MPGGADPFRTMDNEARNARMTLTAGNRHLAAGCDCDMDRAGRPVGEPVKLGRGAMAQRSSWSGPQNGRPQHASRAGSPVNVA